MDDGPPITGFVETDDAGQVAETEPQAMQCRDQLRN
jgi:hypothetical protein